MSDLRDMTDAELVEICTRTSCAGCGYASLAPCMVCLEATVELARRLATEHKVSAWLARSLMERGCPLPQHVRCDELLECYECVIAHARAAISDGEVGW